jgi:hypothetical protein
MTLEQQAEKLYGDLLAQIGKGGSVVQIRLIVDAFVQIVKRCERESGLRQAIRSAVCGEMSALAKWHEGQASHMRRGEWAYWHLKAAKAIRERWQE